MRQGKGARKISVLTLFVILALSGCSTAGGREVAWRRVKFSNCGLSNWAVSPDLRWAICIDDRKGMTLGELREDFFQPVVVAGGFFWEAAFSPDSTKVAVAVPKEQGEEVWVMEVPDIQRRRMVYRDERVHGMEWSPDNRWIAVVGADFVTRVVDLNGRVQPGVVPAAPYGKFRAFFFTWSPEGKRILYVEVLRPVNPRCTLWEVDVASGERRLVLTMSPGSWGYPFWSPRGSWIALAGAKEWRKGVTFINERGEELLFVEVPISYSLGSRWSPDGRKFAVPAREERGAEGFVYTISVISLPRGDRIDLPTEGDLVLLGWTPDSKGIIVRRQEFGGDVLIRLPLEQE